MIPKLFYYIYDHLFRLNVEERDLSNKIAVITGGDDGIGFETALHLARMKCRVVIASRDIQKSDHAAEIIKHMTSNKEIYVEHVDFESLNSVIELGNTILEKYPRVDIFINNVGVLTYGYNETLDGYERCTQVNYLVPWVLTQKVLPCLKRAPMARVVFVSSELHQIAKFGLSNDLLPQFNNYNGITTYANTKLMLIMFTKELAKRLSHTNITFSSLDPGFVNTKIAYRNLPDSWWAYFFKSIAPIGMRLFARSGSQGALNSVYCAISENIESGAYYQSCKENMVHQCAMDEELCRKLWNDTQELLNIDLEN